MAIGVGNTTGVLRVIDKMDKIGKEGVSKVLRDEFGLSHEIIQKALKPSEINSSDLSFIDSFNSLGVKSDLADLGIKELASTYSNLVQLGCENFQVDLSFVRGFDYYTGIILEGKFLDDPLYGSICSGGRYDNLGERLTNKKLPGVGFSLGLTRIFAKLVDEDYFKTSENNSVDVLIIRTGEEDLREVVELANVFRGKDLNVEIYHSPTSIKNQFSYASKKGIPWVWLASKTGKGVFEVKNMKTREQTVASPREWTPD